MSTDQFNLDTRGGDLVGVVFGGTGNQASGSKTTTYNYGAAATVTVDQVMQQLAKLETMVQGSTMTNVMRNDTLDSVRAAQEALSRETPNPRRAKAMMEGALEEVKSGGATPVIGLVTAVVEMLRALAG
jgi:hypothetical protein